MMRKIGFWLVGMALLAGSVSSSLAATGTTASGPANVLVVFNLASAQSVALAHYYQSARGIPDANMLGLNCPASWAPETHDTVSAADYTTYIYNPIVTQVSALNTAGGRIDYVLLCRNLPFQVTISSGTSTFLVSGDTSLMLPGGFADEEDFNDFYDSPLSFADYKAGNFVNPNSTGTAGLDLSFLVSRLDGWTWDDAFRLVDQATALRSPLSQVFLNVSTFWDTADKGQWKSFNDGLRVSAAAMTAAGVSNRLVTSHFTAPSAPVSGYVSWANGDPGYSLSAFNRVSFTPGALAFLNTAASASALRNRPSDLLDQSAQFSALIATGVTGGIAQMENFIDLLDSRYFLENYYTKDWNLIDSLYSSLGYVGAEAVVIGDPLCTYTGPGFASIVPPSGVRATAAIGGMDDWHTAGTVGRTDATDTTMHSNSTVGGTSSWINGGGAGKSDTSHGW